MPRNETDFHTRAREGNELNSGKVIVDFITSSWQLWL